MALPTFTASYDVVVVGYGFAGANAAMAAADAGASVLLAEKELYGGGISICSYGSLRCAHSADEAFAYLQKTNAGRTPDDLLHVLADEMTTLEGKVRALAAVTGAEVMTRENGGNYPFPGNDTFYDTNVVVIPGHDTPAELYPNLVGSNSANGWKVFKVLEDNIARRPTIEIRTGFPARRLIVDDERRVRGVWFGGNNGSGIAVEARRGVILTCGGFEANLDMKQQYWEKLPVLSAATTNNTGDGIRMAQDVGAELWHMWHFHGSYGFQHPDPKYPVALRAKRLPDWVPGREDRFKVKMAWVIVDQDGRRYMNECPPYTQDTSHRPMSFYDPARQTFPRIPSFMVYDENARQLYPVGAPTSNKAELTFDWSDDNLREIELGIIKKADTVSELARAIGCDAAVLETTLERWNAFCQAGKDAEFGRPPGSMVPVDTPPFYVGEVWPMVTNTQGGPVHNTRQQVMDVFGEPIPRLYAAGELGSVFAHLYLSAGNLTECFVGGRIAGRDAANQEPFR